MPLLMACAPRLGPIVRSPTMLTGAGSAPDLRIVTMSVDLLARERARDLRAAVRDGAVDRRERVDDVVEDDGDGLADVGRRDLAPAARALRVHRERHLGGVGERVELGAGVGDDVAGELDALVDGDELVDLGAVGRAGLRARRCRAGPCPAAGARARPARRASGARRRCRRLATMREDGRGRPRRARAGPSRRTRGPRRAVAAAVARRAARERVDVEARAGGVAGVASCRPASRRVGVAARDVSAVAGVGWRAAVAGRRSRRRCAAPSRLDELRRPGMQAELELGRAAEQVAHALRLVDAGQLDRDAARALALDERLRDAEAVDALADDLLGAHERVLDLGPEVGRRPRGWCCGR